MSFLEAFRSTAVAAEPGHPNEYRDAPGVITGDAGFSDRPTDQPRHGTPRDEFQDTAPAYAGRKNIRFMDSQGVPAPLYNTAPAPGSENLNAPRYEGQVGGHNRLMLNGGPVTGAPASEWSGHRTELPRNAVGNKGPVAGGRDGAQLAVQAYFAQQAAYFSQAASDAAMVAAL